MNLQNGYNSVGEHAARHQHCNRAKSHGKLYEIHLSAFEHDPYPYVCRVISLLYFSVATVAGCVCDCRPHNLLHSNSILVSVLLPLPPSRVRPFTKFTLYSLCAFFLFRVLSTKIEFSLCVHTAYRLCRSSSIFARGSDM